MMNAANTTSVYDSFDRHGTANHRPADTSRIGSGIGDPGDAGIGLGGCEVARGEAGVGLGGHGAGDPGDAGIGAGETLITLTEAAKCLPNLDGRKVSVCTIWRWCRGGLRGVFLQYVRVGRRVCTSRAAMERFFAAVARLDRRTSPDGRTHHSTSPSTGLPGHSRTPAAPSASLDVRSGPGGRADVPHSPDICPTANSGAPHCRPVSRRQSRRPFSSRRNPITSRRRQRALAEANAVLERAGI